MSSEEWFWKGLELFSIRNKENGFLVFWSGREKNTSLSVFNYKFPVVIFKLVKPARNETNIQFIWFFCAYRLKHLRRFCLEVFLFKSLKREILVWARERSFEPKSFWKGRKFFSFDKPSGWLFLRELKHILHFTSILELVSWFSSLKLGMRASEGRIIKFFNRINKGQV